MIQSEVIGVSNTRPQSKSGTSCFRTGTSRPRYLVTTPLIHLFCAIAFAGTYCAFGIRRMYRLYAKPSPSVPTMLPTDTRTSGACGWMSLTRCKDTSNHDFSSLGRGVDVVEEKMPMAKQLNLEPIHNRMEDWTMKLSVHCLYLLLRSIQDGQHAEGSPNFSPITSSCPFLTDTLSLRTTVIIS